MSTFDAINSMMSGGAMPSVKYSTMLCTNPTELIYVTQDKQQWKTYPIDKLKLDITTGDPVAQYIAQLLNAKEQAYVGMPGDGEVIIVKQSDAGCTLNTITTKVMASDYFFDPGHTSMIPETFQLNEPIRVYSKEVAEGVSVNIDPNSPEGWSQFLNSVDDSIPVGSMVTVAKKDSLANIICKIAGATAVVDLPEPDVKKFLLIKDFDIYMPADLPLRFIPATANGHRGFAVVCTGLMTEGRFDLFPSENPNYYYRFYPAQKFKQIAVCNFVINSVIKAHPELAQQEAKLMSNITNNIMATVAGVSKIPNELILELGNMFSLLNFTIIRVEPKTGTAICLTDKGKQVLVEVAFNYSMPCNPTRGYVNQGFGSFIFLPNTRLGLMILGIDDFSATELARTLKEKYVPAVNTQLYELPLLNCIANTFGNDETEGTQAISILLQQSTQNAQAINYLNSARANI